MTIFLKTITVEIQGKEFEFTLDEALDLANILNSLVGQHTETRGWTSGDTVQVSETNTFPVSVG